MRGIVGIFLLGVTAFGVYAGIGIKRLMNICYKFGGLKFKGFTDANDKPMFLPFNAKYLVIDVMMKIYNPSYLSATIEKYSIVASINNYNVSKLTNPEPVILNKSGWTILTLPIKVDLEKSKDLYNSPDFLKNLAAKNFSKIILTLSGTLTGGLLGFNVHDYKLNITMNFQDIMDSANAPDVPCGE
jgi:LEA14-like dessication related protein